MLTSNCAIPLRHGGPRPPLAMTLYFILGTCFQGPNKNISKSGSRQYSGRTRLTFWNPDAFTSLFDAVYPPHVFAGGEFEIHTNLIKAPLLNTEMIQLIYNYQSTIKSNISVCCSLSRNENATLWR